ncbi:MAG: hypothetical protein R2697_03600 [Ilumatobacteraceae bacterium]
MRVARRPTSVRQVTSGDWGIANVTWHPDGRTVAFEADLYADADLHQRTSIWAVDVDAGPQSKRSRPRTARRRRASCPDRRSAPTVDGSRRWVWSTPSRSTTSAWSAAGAPHRRHETVQLSAHLDRPIGAWCDTDLHGWMVRSYRSDPLDERTIVAAITDRGRSLPSVG